MKRLARRTVLIAAVLAVLAIMVSAAVYGYFTSSKTIANNVVSTGNITLEVGTDGVAAPVALTHLMPGNTGTVGDYLIKNIGDTSGTLWVGVRGHPGAFDEPLAQVLQVAYWLDVDKNGVWSGTDKYFVPDGHYKEFAAGDTPALPAGAFNSLLDWNTKYSNSLDVPAGEAGLLKMTYLFPPNVDDPAFMSKACSYDLLIELHQFHPETNTATITAVSGHTGAQWAAYADGILVDTGTVGGNGYVMTLPADSYTVVFTQDLWSFSRTVDVSQNDITFDLPV